MKLELTVSRNDDMLLLDLKSPADQNTVGQVHHRYFVYENNLSTEVESGENSGELLKHEQVVRYMSRAITLNPENQYSISIDPDWKSDNIGVAVLVTFPGNQTYLQAVHTPVASLLTQ